MTLFVTTTGPPSRARFQVGSFLVGGLFSSQKAYVAPVKGLSFVPLRLPPEENCKFENTSDEIAETRRLHTERKRERERERCICIYIYVYIYIHIHHTSMYLCESEMPCQVLLYFECNHLEKRGCKFRRWGCDRGENGDPVDRRCTFTRKLFQIGSPTLHVCPWVRSPPTHCVAGRTLDVGGLTYKI